MLEASLCEWIETCPSWYSGCLKPTISRASGHTRQRCASSEARKDELAHKVAEAEEPPPLLYPSLAAVYRERIVCLSQALHALATRDETAKVVRSLVSAIELVPEGGRLAIVLRGDLAAMLAFAAHKKRPGDPLLKAGLASILLWRKSLGAGTRNQRFLRLVERRIPKQAA